MNRRAVLGLAGLLPFALPVAARAAPLSAQDRADIARVERYLDTLKTLKSRFLQIAPDGNTSEGNAWLARPGRLRFEYDPPAPFLLVAGYGVVMFHDRKLQQTSSFPISQTPLGILLSEKAKLSGEVTVGAVFREPGLLQVSVFRTASPGEGGLTLGFADNPLQLRQWSVVDAQRMETRVTLFNIQLGERFDEKLFDVTDPRTGTNLAPNR
ncbi:MAG: outer membrane lipoprotein carrier protein LolA [Alphaproteobacteria bacterium]|nr:outer membrane lipoprotein carrier protein LolA [Alphaproteobacteria bacterium]